MPCSHPPHPARLALFGLPLCVFLLVFSCFLELPGLCKAAGLASALALAVGLRSVSCLRGYQFTAWILVAVTAGMLYPAQLLHWGDFDLRNKWLILAAVQMVMFGMGTQMSLSDFKGVARNPKGVLVGIVCQFTIMPFVGYGLTRLFSFPDEIAAGIVLIGCCASGLASNVMAYLAGANLALSVTVTSITTLVAPVMTPLLMKLLAGTLVEVSFSKMMLEIVKIVLVPIGAALLHDYLKTAERRQVRLARLFGVAAVLWGLALVLGGWAWLGARLAPTGMLALELSCFVAGAVVFGQLYHRAVCCVPRLSGFMPLLSMAGIVYFTTVTTAAGRDNLLQVGVLLLLASMIHNGAGYFLGYGLSRLSGLDVQSARSVAFEVGLQNGGMASGLAGAMGKLATVGLAAAIFSPWMNISGSILANYWKRRPVGPVALEPLSVGTASLGDEAEQAVSGSVSSES